MKINFEVSFLETIISSQDDLTLIYITFTTIIL